MEKRTIQARGKMKNTPTEKIFRQINYFVLLLVKRHFHEIFVKVVYSALPFQFHARVFTFLT